MALANLFSISVYVMLAMASLILGMAEMAEGALPFPALLTIPLAIVAYVYSERQSVLVLSGAFANLCALVALGACALEFFSNHHLAPVRSGAHLLVYLSWMVIFLQKDRHHYWWTCALSLLLVAVASVISDSLGFGLMLILFTIVSVFTLSLFSVYTTFRDEVDEADTEVRASGFSQRINERQIHYADGLVLFDTPSRALGGLEVDSRARWIGLRFGGRTLQISLTCLALGLVFFLLIPRLWSDMSQFGSESIGGRNVSGFSAEVRLGQMGEILESTQLALRVEIFKNENDAPISVPEYAQLCGFEEPLFRGAVLDAYDDEVWRNSVDKDKKPEIMHKLGLSTGFRQEYERESLGTQHLFCMHPISNHIAIRSPKDEAVQHTATLVTEHRKPQSSRYEYVVYATHGTLARGAQFRAFGSSDELTPWSMTPYLDLPERRVGRLIAHARIVADFKRTRGDRRDRIENELKYVDRIMTHLRDSGEYTYSLRNEIIDPKVDPIEDFLFNRKQGHCEYFASALALMLRSVGIPSRMVTGYKGGLPETPDNPASKAWIVQQRHAHAWVEAYYSGEWHTLDATPAEERELAVDQAGQRDWSWSSMRDTMHDLWNRYVVAINFRQQQRMFYDPSISEARNSWAAIKETWQGDNPLKTFWNFLRNPRRWFSLEGALVSFVLMLILLGLYFVVRRLMRLFRRLRPEDNARRARIKSAEFYERFLRLCERQNLKRGRTQTPREFAGEVAEKWSVRLSADRLGEMPASLIERFYAFRYGDVPLTADEERTLAESLSRLETALVPETNGQSRNGHS